MVYNVAKTSLTYQWKGADETFIIGFKGFSIGKRQSYLDVIGTPRGGFTTVQDNGVDIPVI